MNSSAGGNKRRDEKVVIFDERERYRNIIYNICDNSGINRDIDVDGYENGVRRGRE